MPGEGLLVAEPVEVGDPEFLAVEVGVEVEDVDLEGVDAVGGEGGARAEVHDGLVPGEVGGDAGAAGVDAARRQELFDPGEVGGGEAHGAAAHVALDDLAGDGVGAAEELRGFLEFALRDGFADAGAADRCAVEHDGCDGLHAEAVLVGEGGEAVGVAGAILAEGPVLADGDFAQVGKDAGDLVDELRRLMLRSASSNLTATTETVPWARM